MKAKDIKSGIYFTYVGAFVMYHAASDAYPDEDYPGKVLLDARRGEKFMSIRLDAEQEVTVVR